MLTAVILLLVGAAILTLGAEAAIRGTARFARERGISMFVLGAVLFGIDLESLAAALIAAGKGRASLAAGSAFGTMAFLLGIAFALILEGWRTERLRSEAPTERYQRPAA